MEKMIPETLAELKTAVWMLLDFWKEKEAFVINMLCMVEPFMRDGQPTEDDVEKAFCALEAEGLVTRRNAFYDHRLMTAWRKVDGASLAGPVQC